MLGLLGLLGDLTASMLKRDAGLKDFGDLLRKFHPNQTNPSSLATFFSLIHSLTCESGEHGGVLDRVDSFIWSAPYSWLVYTAVIPALKQCFA